MAKRSFEDLKDEQNVEVAKEVKKPRPTYEDEFDDDDLIEYSEYDDGDDGFFSSDDEETDNFRKTSAYNRKARKSRGTGIKIVDNVIPISGDSVFEIIRKVIFIVSVTVAIISVVILIRDALESKKQEKLDDSIAEIVEEVRLTGNIPLSDEKVEEVKKEVPGILDEYIALYEQNNDLIGYIEIEGTAIDYPVLQAEDNDFYLFKNFEKEYSIYGSIYASFRVPFTADKRPNNTILYGHNIVGGRYFAKVSDYYPAKVGGISYYINHPTIQFDTIYEKGTYKIFAGGYYNTQEEHGKIFPYHDVTSFPTKADFYDYIGNVMDRSTFYTGVDLEYGDEILTLSTCYYQLGENIDTRFAVFARRVREGEDPEVDTSVAYVNPSPLYFDYYYQVVGGSWGGRNWDLSLVKGFEEFITNNPDTPIALNN